MADQHNANVPAMGNQISADIPDIKENLEFHKDAFQLIWETWSDTDNSSNSLDSALGWSDGTYTYDFPTNGIAAHSVIMLGNSSTILWMYLNTAPPGWKVLTTGEDSVLAVKATARASGTADGNTANHLIDAGSGDFVNDGVVVGDTAYNITDGTSALVTVVAATDLTLASYAFPDGNEEYEVGTKFVDPGGNQADAGSWEIAGITVAAHSTHNHTMTATGRDALGESGTTYYFPTTKTISTGGPTTHTVAFDETYRPVASIGRLFQLDTA